MILPETVTNVGNYAFYSAGSGKGRFECPADGTVYENSALYDSRFISVAFGTNADLSAKSILGNFRGETVSIGDGTTEIGEYFLTSGVKVESLKEVRIPDSLKKIGRSAFKGNLGLKEIDLKNVEEIGEMAFSETGLVSITVPGTCRSVPASCFTLCPYLKSVTLEEGVETVEDYAFSSAGRTDSAKMKSAYYYLLYPDEYEQWKDKLYDPDDPDVDSALSVYLPSTIRHMGRSVFSGCWVNGVYMTWCDDPSVIGSVFSSDTFSGVKYFLQTYFTEETINAIGDELDAELLKLEDCSDNAYFDEGDRIYFSNLKNLD